MLTSLKMQKKIVAYWSLFSILFNIAQPAIIASTLLYPSVAYAAPAPVTFNSSTHSFQIDSNPSGLSYKLYYQTPTIIETAQGVTPSTVYAGTMSGSVGTPHTILSGILKVVKNNSITASFFTMNGDILTIVKESGDDSTDLSESDIAWLRNPSGATEEKIKICHATASDTNPYNLLEVAASAVDAQGNGNSDHNRLDHQGGQDIIPPGEWDADGLNWDDSGQEIWNNSCLVKTNLTVIKQVVGGSLTPADFTVHVVSVAAEVVGSPAVGSLTGTTYTLNPGTYIVSENDPATQNYVQTSIACDGVLTNQVSIVTSKNSTCTIVNTYVPPVVTSSDVTICKQDVNGRGLAGWRLALLGDLHSTYAIPVNGSSLSSSLLPLGNYVVKASGVYKYSTGTSWIADAGHSLRVPNQSYSFHTNPYDTWVSGDNLAGYVGALELKVNDSNIDWGNYNPEHNYYFGYPTHSGTLGFRIWDDQYSDNSSPFPAPLTANIYNGHVGTTGVDGCLTFADVAVGSYDIEESQQEGWENVSGLGEVAVDSATHNFTVINRDTTITNQGTITIDKVTNPVSDETSFSFNVKAGESVMGSADLADATDPKIFSLPDGSYSVSESSKIGWVQTGVSCVDGDQILDPSSLLVTSASDILCTFSNTKLGVISGTKFGDEDGDINTVSDRDPILGWNITLWLDGSQVGSTNTDASGLYTFLGLIPGAYQVRETEQSGWLNLLPLWINSVIGAGDTSEGNDFVNTAITDNTITICHATASTSNPYIQQSPNTKNDGSLVGGHFNHAGPIYPTDKWGDIIPAYILGDFSYPGMNWDAQGQAIWNNNCNPNVYGSITVYKEVDPDLEQLFTFNLGGEATDSAEILGGSFHIFADLLPGTYDLTEDMPSGWAFNSANCGESSYLPGEEIILEAGENLSCTFYNTSIEPTLRIQKSNNATGSKNAGDIVTYTIVVDLLGSSLQEVELTDVSPEGFEYISGSWSSTKPGVLEPNYGSPGTWNLGSMEPEDSITLSYQAKISTEQDAGTYSDAAWAEGTSSVWGDTLALGHDSTYVDEIFVGTDVVVSKPSSQTGSVNIEKITSNGEVLGASTSLPSTGVSTGWLLTAVFLLIAGVSLALGGKRTRKILTSIFVFLSLFTSSVVIKPVGAIDPSNHLSVRLEVPSSPTRSNSWKLSYSVLDRAGNTPVTTCFVKKPSALSAVSFDVPHLSVKSVGDNYYCQINSSVMNEQGNYEFYIVANSGSDSEESSHVFVNYDVSGPGTPNHFSKDHASMCRWNIKFHTADDSGATTRVEIYSSDQKSFDTNSGTRVGTVNIGSNQDGTFTHDRADNCDKEWFYVIRSFDAAGNQSDVVGDSVTISGTTSTSSPVQNIAGALVKPSTTGGSISNKKDTTIDDSSNAGEVLGEEMGSEPETVENVDMTGGSMDSVINISKNKYVRWILAFVVILGATYVILRKKAHK